MATQERRAKEGCWHAVRALRMLRTYCSLRYAAGFLTVPAEAQSNFQQFENPAGSPFNTQGRAAARKPREKVA
ncbi:hypothetical protein HPP92_012802 [Vanilla planifolia]|uniref:Uncharacterized protein n=1 Tax=Vanilla planifolia TaxID=51239 RepID=A0A835R169_VANPL|nr:hypothetical protein HPP92_012802 [Vanilla planifolia]